MNISNLVSTASLVNRFGVKAVIYGGPGTGKTPLLTTASAPVICFTEPGFLSVRNYNGPAYPAFTHKEIREFWLWAVQSQEARQFQTFCCDSISQLAEIILKEEMPLHKDPRKAYFELVTKTMEIAEWIYYTPNFNVVMTGKERMDDDGKARCYFPGNELNIRIPHLFDSVWRLELMKDAKGVLQRVIRTKETFNAFARDRSGNLAEIEPADLNYLFNKARV